MCGCTQFQGCKNTFQAQKWNSISNSVLQNIEKQIMASQESTVQYFVTNSESVPLDLEPGIIFQNTLSKLSSDKWATFFFLDFRKYETLTWRKVPVIVLNHIAKRKSLGTFYWFTYFRCINYPNSILGSPATKQKLELASWKFWLNSWSHKSTGSSANLADFVHIVAAITFKHDWFTINPSLVFTCLDFSNESGSGI